MDYAMVTVYVLSMLVLAVRVAQNRQRVFDGVGKRGLVTACLLILCPGLNTLLALSAMLTWKE